jgi:hypothetical protein
MSVLRVPSVDEVAVQAAHYLTREFTHYNDWMFHEEELARELLKQSNFVCAIEWATPAVMERMRSSRQMQGYAAERGAKGIAALIGHVVGEWTNGKSTLARELDSWG